MLEPDPADIRSVIHRIVVLASWLCCALVVASFALFARDQLSGASKHQVAALQAGTPVTPGVAPQPVHHVSQPRAFIDGAANKLMTPFSSIVESDNSWVEHGLPTLFALIVYGVGLGYLARFSRGRS
jgi:hypothetical protein